MGLIQVFCRFYWGFFHVYCKLDLREFRSSSDFHPIETRMQNCLPSSNKTFFPLSRLHWWPDVV